MSYLSLWIIIIASIFATSFFFSNFYHHLQSLYSSTPVVVFMQISISWSGSSSSTSKEICNQQINNQQLFRRVTSSFLSIPFLSPFQSVSLSCLSIELVVNAGSNACSLLVVCFLAFLLSCMHACYALCDSNSPSIYRTPSSSLQPTNYSCFASARDTGTRGANQHSINPHSLSLPAMY